jgi:hypothetical protein
MKVISSLVFIFLFQVLNAQTAVLSGIKSNSFDLLQDRKEKTIKSGTYFGLQSGRFYVLEYGWERQRKVKQGFLNYNTTALHHGLNVTYDFSRLNPVVGYDLGFWRRTGNFDLTYGLNAAIRTDLRQVRFGVCPTVGIKVWQLHVQTGMYLLAPFFAFNDNTFNSNTFFISARFLLVQDKKERPASPPKGA